MKINGDLIVGETTKKLSDAYEIVDSGSNSNGSWIKWSDGTMICTKLATAIIPSWTAWGTIYEANFLLGNYPKTFVGDTPTVIVTNMSGAGWWVEARENYTNSNAGRLWINRPNTYNDLEVLCAILAIGRWK